jgi:proline iminopeptidase
MLDNLTRTGNLSGLMQQFVEVDGARLEIFRGGAGRPVVCCSHPHYPAELESDRWYSEHTELVYVMPRGLGNSSPVREGRDLTYLQAAHDLEAVRRELSIASWVLQGFSGGSQVALLYALTYPDSLAGLIVGHGVASFARAMADSRSVGNPQNPRYRPDLSADRRRGAPRRVAVVSSPEHYWLQLHSDLWAFFRGETPLFMMPTEHLHIRFQAACEEVVYFEVADRLKEIRVPVLVVCGRHDDLVSVKDCAGIHAGIPDSRLLVLEHSGHGADGADVETFHQAVLRFLAPLADWTIS